MCTELFVKWNFVMEVRESKEWKLKYERICFLVPSEKKVMVRILPLHTKRADIGLGPPSS